LADWLEAESEIRKTVQQPHLQRGFSLPSLFRQNTLLKFNH